MSEQELLGATKPSDWNTLPQDAGRFAADWNRMSLEHREKLVQDLRENFIDAQSCRWHRDRADTLQVQLAAALAMSDADREVRIRNDERAAVMRALDEALFGRQTQDKADS